MFQIDPYQVELGPSLLNNSVFKIEHFVLHGLSSFYRIGKFNSLYKLIQAVFCGHLTVLLMAFPKPTEAG
jgi:hypothetical protein